MPMDEKRLAEIRARNAEGLAAEVDYAVTDIDDLIDCVESMWKQCAASDSLAGRHHMRVVELEAEVDRLRAQLTSSEQARDLLRAQLEDTAAML